MQCGGGNSLEDRRTERAVYAAVHAQATSVSVRKHRAHAPSSDLAEEVKIEL
jgi:hypothetical protein